MSIMYYMNTNMVFELNTPPYTQLFISSITVHMPLTNQSLIIPLLSFVIYPKHLT